MAALYCAVGPDSLMKVIASASLRWKPHQFQLMKSERKKFWLFPIILLLLILGKIVV
jgi:hypothetical protein